MNFKKAISDLKKELQNDVSIELISFTLFDPVNEEKIRDAESSFGYKLPKVLVDFYRFSNGLQVRWKRKDEENEYKEEIMNAGDPFRWSWPAEHYWQLDGLINILNLDQFLFGSYKDFMWFDFEAGYSVSYFDKKINLLQFKKELRPFDVFDKYYTVAVYAADGSFDVLLGDDHNADFLHYGRISLDQYFQKLFATWGSVKARPGFF